MDHREYSRYTIVIGGGLKFYDFIERIPEVDYRGKFFFARGNWTLKFINAPSKNPCLELVRSTFYKKLLFFNVPVRSFKVCGKNLEILSVALGAISHAYKIALTP